MKTNNKIKSVKSRKELSDLLETLNNKGIRARISKSIKEGYKYDVSYEDDYIEEEIDAEEDECSMDKELNEEGYLKHFSDVDQVFADLKDRALNIMSESEDPEEDASDAVYKAIDEGLAYDEDVWLIAKKYVNSSELLNLFYETLADDLYEQVKEEASNSDNDVYDDEDDFDGFEMEDDEPYIEKDDLEESKQPSRPKHYSYKRITRL